MRRGSFPPEQWVSCAPRRVARPHRWGSNFGDRNSRPIGRWSGCCGGRRAHVDFGRPQTSMRQTPASGAAVRPARTRYHPSADRSPGRPALGLRLRACSAPCRRVGKERASCRTSHRRDGHRARRTRASDPGSRRSASMNRSFSARVRTRGTIARCGAWLPRWNDRESSSRVVIPSEASSPARSLQDATDFRSTPSSTRADHARRARSCSCSTQAWGSRPPAVSSRVSRMRGGWSRCSRSSVGLG